MSIIALQNHMQCTCLQISTFLKNKMCHSVIDTYVCICSMLCTILCAWTFCLDIISELYTGVIT